MGDNMLTRILKSALTGFPEVWLSHNGAADVTQVDNLLQVNPLNVQLYSGAVAGNSGLLGVGTYRDYTDWTFYIKGATATDLVDIQITLDGTNLQTARLVECTTGLLAASPTPVDGIYKFGVAANIFTPAMVVEGLKVVRTGAGTAAVEVWATARPVL